MIMPAEYDKKKVRFCQICGEQILKSKNQGWKGYSKRKYCGRTCMKENPKALGIRKDDISLGEYIANGSKNGRLMADFNLGVLQAVEKIGHDAELSENARGVICTYKGVPVTGDVVKTANQWLMDNWMGKAGQRNAPPEVDNRTSDEKMRELEYVVKELGYRLVKIGE